MVAPPIAAMSSCLPPPYPAVVEQPTEKALVSESTPSQLSFPNEFPYEFETFSSAFTSPGDSTETEDETTDDEDDFFAGLTRRLALSTQRLTSPPSFVTDKAEVKPQVTESSLSRLGSFTTSGNRSPDGPFSQAPSPPTSPFCEEEALKVISAAAGEVAKIKMANLDAKPTSRPNANPNPYPLLPFPPNAAFYHHWLWQPQYHQYRMRFESTLQPGLIASPYPVRGVSTAPTAVKKPSAGTGVFLPRNYSNPSDSKKKSGGECVKLPTKKVVQQEKPKQPVCLTTGRNKIDSDCMVTKSSPKQERHLPQEWMY